MSEEQPKRRARRGDPGRWEYRNPARAWRIGEMARREGTTPRQVRNRRKAARRAEKARRDAIASLPSPLSRILLMETEAKP